MTRASLHPLVAGDVVRGGERGEVRDRVGEQLPRQRVESADPLDRVAPPLDPVPGLLVAGEHLERVALDAEGAPRAAHVVPLVLDVDEPLHRELHREVRAASRSAGAAPRTAPESRGRRCRRRSPRSGRRVGRAARPSPSAAAARSRRSPRSPSRCRCRSAGRRPRAGSSRNSSRSTRRRCRGRPRGTRWRAARRGTCWARSPGSGAGPVRPDGPP